MNTAQNKTRRLNSVDLLRGIVMVIMLLDHTRDFFHRDALDFDPTDLTKTNTILFFTRWITHFCAPIFVFLAGTSSYLQTLSGKSKADLSAFLIKRGLWLILLEFTVIRTLIWFNFDYHLLATLQVIWAIGVSMIVLAGLIYLPLRVVAMGSVAIIALHNLLDGIQVNSWAAPDKPLPGFWGSVWILLHQQGVVYLTPKVYVLALYPLIPWVAVLQRDIVSASSINGNLKDGNECCSSWELFRWWDLYCCAPSIFMAIQVVGVCRKIGGSL